jgi:hypothetical protein
VPEEDVYQCDEVISRINDGVDDYALVRLDRSTSRIPFVIRRTGIIGDNDDLVVEGYPSSLPLKIDQGGAVRDNTPTAYFEANLDTFGGNSGSVVFVEDTGVAEGILVRGNRDYNWDSDNSCYTINTCSDTGCPGWEEIQRITRLPLDLVPLHTALINTASITALL